MCSPNLSKLFVLLLGVDMTSSSTQTIGLATELYLYTPVPSAVVIFGMNCVTFKYDLKVLAHVNKVLLPLIQQVGQ